MFKKHLMFYAPNDSSGSNSDNSEPTLEQVQKQVVELKEKYETLQAKVTEGKLVEPKDFLERKIKDGEVFPKDRFVGLQKRIQEELEPLIATLKTENGEFKTNFSNLEKSLKTRETEVQDRDAELGKLRPGMARAKVIFAKFPELAAFESEGLLPAAEEDKLEEVFGAFAAKLSTIKQSATAEFGKGGASPSPAKKEEPKMQTASALLKQANEALGLHDMPAYNKFYDNYLKALMSPQ